MPGFCPGGQQGGLTWPGSHGGGLTRRAFVTTTTTHNQYHVCLWTDELSGVQRMSVFTDRAPVDWAHDLFGPDDWAQPVSRLGPASWSVGPTLGRFGPPPVHGELQVQAIPRGVGLSTVKRYSLGLQIKIWWQRRRGLNILNVNYRVVGLVHGSSQFHLSNQHGDGICGVAAYWGWPDLSQGVRVPKQREVSRAVGTSHVYFLYQKSPKTSSYYNTYSRKYK